MDLPVCLSEGLSVTTNLRQQVLLHVVTTTQRHADDTQLKGSFFSFLLC